MDGQDEYVTQGGSSEQMIRLATIGEKVATLAHDSRNAVNISKMSVELLRMRIPNDAEGLEIAESIERAQNDLAQLYEELCQFASPCHLKVRPVDLGQLWRDAWQHLAHEHQVKAIALHEEIAGVDLWSEADPFAIRRVWSNILQNAIQASPHGGSVLVRGHHTLLDGRPAVRVAFADQGPGMTREQRERLFSPFFTTKDGGTGLGMAIVQHIVQEHGGQVSVTARNGPGAEINVVMPRRVVKVDRNSVNGCESHGQAHLHAP